MCRRCGGNAGGSFVYYIAILLQLRSVHSSTHLIDVRNHLFEFGVRYLPLCKHVILSRQHFTPHTSTFIEEHLISSIRLKVGNIDEVIDSAVNIGKSRLIRSEPQLLIHNKAIGVFAL